jgi:pimeloyl-ACP methyl ester carboxylesterase
MFGDGAASSIEERMREVCSDLRGVKLVPDAGHWVQQEKPKETTGLIIDWLATL